MPISIPRLRIWFAALAVAVILVVAGFYFYARLRMRQALKEIPQKLGVEIQQSTEGFSLSKSEGGRTLFTIRASKAVQYKLGGRAELKGVDIIVYGRKANRFDQIHGSDFDYDPQAGTISAKGEVQIDLEGNEEGPLLPDQALPKELKNPIHLKTSGLVFNQKTGIAHTDNPIEFRIASASGSAVGVTYDSHSNQLTLESNVNINTDNGSPTVIHAAHGVVTKDPRELHLSGVHVEQTARKLDADSVLVSFNDQNDVSHVAAFGNVRLSGEGREPFEVQAPRADLQMGPKNQVRMAVFSGGVQFGDRGANPISGVAGKLTANFGEGNRVRTIYATDNVKLMQQPGDKGKNQQSVELAADALNATVKNGRQVEFMETSGAARMTMTPASGPDRGERTVITAGQFHADFDARNRLKLVRGEPDVRVVSSSPGQPDRTSMSRTLDVQFAPGGGVTSIVQEGNFEYHEPQVPGAKQPGARAAYADKARYTPDDDTLTLTGSPRFIDGGMTITARSLRVNRRTGDAFAQGDVKTTYSELRQQPNGALFATADPVHVTASAMNAQRQSGIARYTGGARIWQGANIVEAPTLEFNRDQRSVVAQGTATQAVSSVFVQVDKSGKTTPVVVTAASLNYVDAERRARFSGGVLAKGPDLMITAGHVDVYLHPASTRGALASGGPSQLERMVAENRVVIQEAGRRATGEKLVYTASDGKFVLTGGPPTVTDPDRGTLRGDSLTFYSHDDRVVVESNGSSRTVTRTRVKR